MSEETTQRIIKMLEEFKFELDEIENKRFNELMNKPRQVKPDEFSFNGALILFKNRLTNIINKIKKGK